MANQVNTQILLDGHRNAIVKITGVLDTSNVAVTDLITTAMFNNSPTGFSIHHLDYSISDPLEVRLQWTTPSDAANVDILPIAGRGKMSFGSFGGLQNNATNPTGGISLLTTGYNTTLGTTPLVFSVVLEMVKLGTQ
jgi:hypothetical protein